MNSPMRVLKGWLEYESVVERAFVEVSRVDQRIVRRDHRCYVCRAETNEWCAEWCTAVDLMDYR